jgi:glycosyltransferase involved in cell wall biosynthesis
MTLIDIQKYPKVLIVNSEPINSLTATGLTMMNLFQNWTAVNIAQIYTQPLPCEGKCLFSRRVTLLDLNLPKNLKEWIFRHTKDAKVCQLNQRVPFIEYTNTLKKRPIIFYKNYRGDINTLLNLFPLKLNHDLYEECENFKPDIIYSMLSSIEMMKLVLHLSNRLKVPVVPHFVDDWPSTHSRNFPFAPLFLPIQTWLLRKIIHRSPVILTICNAMSVEYKRRYKKETHSFMNCVDVSILHRKPPLLDDNKCIRFAYIGGLHLNRWKSLMDIAISLEKIRNEGMNVELVVFAPSIDINSYSDILNSIPVVKIGGTLPSEKVIESLYQFNVLVHIESFDRQNRLFTKFSISTKIPQYMASGKPILAYGPEEVASCNYIKENDCGLIVGKQNLGLLNDTLKSMILDHQLRNRLGSKGRIIASAKHNAEIEREKLRLLLNNILAI